jgi:osmotically-inducible protein OsmY
MTDYDLERHVSDELAWEPRLDAAAIAVSADDGIVTLRGTVRSFRQKLEAKKAAERVHGVKRVENGLQVRLMNGDKKDDAELRADVLQALMLDSLVPATIDATVADGFVTLTGTAEGQHQREEAERVAGNLTGVVAVSDEIELMEPRPDTEEIQHSIKKAFARSARIEADDLKITSAEGAVTLEGVVSSWAEHDEAIAAAWAAPGVKKVHDHLEVLP